MKGYYTPNGFYGLVGNTYILFSDETDQLLFRLFFTGEDIGGFIAEGVKVQSVRIQSPFPLSAAIDPTKFSEG